MGRRVLFPYPLVILSVTICYQLYRNNICQAAPALKVLGDFKPSLKVWENNIDGNEYKHRPGSYNKLVPHKLRHYGVDSEDKSGKDGNINEVKINY